MTESMGGFSMFFKSEKRPLWVTLLCVLFLGGCGKFLHDDVKKQKPVALDLECEKCLNDVPVVLQSYFQQRLQPDELHESIKCIDTALVEFLQSTRGEEDASYRSSEIQKFFEKYIFRKEVSPELVLDIMKLKKAMIGGTTDTVTRSEFERLRGLMKLVESEMLRLYPHLGLYFFKEPLHLGIAANKVKLDTAIADLKISVQNLLKGVSLAESDYSLPEAEHLLVEIEKFAGISDENHPFVQWRMNLPTLEKLKSLLVGDLTELRSQREVSEIWDVLIDVYRLGLEYYGGVSELTWNSHEDYRQLDSWVENLFAVFMRGFSLRNKSQISFDRIDHIIDDFYVRKIWIEHLRPETAKITYKRLINRFLDHPDADLLALEQRHLNRLQREYRALSLIQQAVGKVFSNKPLRPTTEVLVVLENYSIEKETKEFRTLSLNDQKFYNEAWREFLALLRDPAHRHWDQKGHVSVSMSKEDRWNYRDLTFYNGWRAAASLFFRAYGNATQEQTKDASLVVEQVRPVYRDFAGVGRDLGLFDLRNSDGASRSLREADMFTPSGNGDERLQFIELVDLFADMWSGGVVGVTTYKSGAEDKKCLTGKEDYFHFPYMELNCSSMVLQQTFSDILPSLPHFTAYVRPMGKDRWESFFKDLLVVGRVCPGDPNGLETGDQRTMLVVLHYIENLFVAYDRNKDQGFDDREVEMAFPRFQTFIVDITKRKVQAEHPDLAPWIWDEGWNRLAMNVFKFLIFKGHVPTSEELDWTDVVSVSNYEGRAQRQNIIRVFAALKAEISENSVDCSGSH